MSEGEVGEDVLEDLITMLAERFPSVVGEERGRRGKHAGSSVDRNQWAYMAT